MRRVSIGQPKDVKRTPRPVRRHTLIGLSINPLDEESSNSNDKLNGSFLSRIPCSSFKPQLPRIRKVNESFTESGRHESLHNTSLSYHNNVNSTPPVIRGRPPLTSPAKRYPTHQPQYNRLGLLPSVTLHKNPRPVLSEHNSAMVSSPVTIKIAPPDTSKPPPPVFLQPEVSKQPADTSPSKTVATPGTPRANNTESVLTALREKRKRIVGEDYVLTSDVHKVSKRRRHTVQVSGADVDAALNGLATASASDTQLPGGKRPASTSPSSEDGDNVSVQKVAKKSKPDEPVVPVKKLVGVKNPQEASLSSSRRAQQRQIRERSLNTSRESSISRRSFAEQNLDSMPTSRATSLSNTPRNSITLDDEIVLALEKGGTSHTSTPYPGTSGRTTPLTDGGDMSDSNKSTPPGTKTRQSLLVKQGSSKRRLLPATVGQNQFDNVPRLRQQLTKEDFARDRLAQVERVQQMLKDVSQEYRAKAEPLISAAPLLSEKPSSTASLAPSSVSLASQATPSSSASTLASLLASTTAASELSSASTATSCLSISSAQSKPSNSLASEAENKQSSLNPSVAAIAPTLGLEPLSMESDGKEGTSLSNALTTVTLFNFKPQSGETANSPVLKAGATETATPTSNGVTVDSVSQDKRSTQPVLASSMLNFAASVTSPAVIAAAISSKSAMSSASSSNMFSNTKISSGILNFGANKDQSLQNASNSSNVNATQGGGAPTLGGFQFGSNTQAQGTSEQKVPENKTPIVPSASEAKPQPTTSAPVAGGFNFGATASPAVAFGQNVPKMATPSTGNSTSVQPETSSTTASATGIFGVGTTASSTSSPFQFKPGNIAATTTPVSSVSSEFQFNAGSSSTTASTAGGLQFTGAAKPATTASNSTGFQFGATTQPASSTANAKPFGASVTGQSNPSTNSGFQFGPASQASSNTGFKFSGSTPQSSSSSSGFQFSAGNPVTATASKRFGSSTISTTHAFGASTNASTSSASGMFTFNASAAKSTTASFNFGAAPASTAAATTNAFGTAPSASTTLVFGAGSSVPAFGSTASTTAAFGSTAPVKPAFGAASSTVAPPSFGSNTVSSAPAFGAGSSSFDFGSSFTASASPAFGTTPAATSQPAQPFGASNNASTGAFGSASASSGFNFGAAAAPASATAFGAASTATPSFGSSGPAFGSTSSVPAFGAAVTTTKTGAAASAPAFGSTSAKALNPFGTAAAATPAFGSSNNTSSTPNPFSNSAAPAGFNFCGANTGAPAFGAGAAAAKSPVFGAASTPAAPAFKTPSAGTQPDSGGGFNFNMSTPTANPFNTPGAPTNFGTPKTPGTGGMFTLGSAGPRAPPKAARRRAMRK